MGQKIGTIDFSFHLAKYGLITYLILNLNPQSLPCVSKSSISPYTFKFVSKKPLLLVITLTLS